MNRIAVIAVVALMVLAGCSTGGPGGATPTDGIGADTADGDDAPAQSADTGDASDETTGDAQAGDGSSSMAAGTGTLDFYLSDQPNAIGDFDHLTVTVTKVGFHRSGATDGDDDSGDDEANESTIPSGSVNVEGTVEYNGSDVRSGSVTLDGNLTESGAMDLNGTVPNGTMTVSGSVDDGGNATLSGDVTYNASDFPDSPNGTVALNGTVTADGTVSLNGTVTLFGDDDPSGNVTLDGSVTADETDGDDEGDAGWIEHDVDDREVDLTQLQGDNATLIETMDLPSGMYTKVFVYVGAINASLLDGGSANVKLPSDRLHLNKPFVIEENESVEFVFDIGVHKAGGSGKYILRPVVGESGTDVPINRVDGNGAANRPDHAGGPNAASGGGPPHADSETSATSGDLEARFVGEVAPGESATVAVTWNGSAAENATVSVNGEELGETDENGEFTFDVDENATSLHVEITLFDEEVELEAEFESDDGGPPDHAKGPDRG